MGLVYGFLIYAFL